jgi:hypothetical protein
MPNDQSLELLSLPSPSVTRLSQSAVQDTIQYFEPDLITIPGPRDAAAYAQVRDAAPDVFVDSPSTRSQWRTHQSLQIQHRHRSS